jgi:signal transduction histidine kinase
MPNLAAALAVAVTSRDVVDAIVRHGAPLVGADSLSIASLQPATGELEVTRSFTCSGGAVAEVQGSERPGRPEPQDVEAFRTRQAVWLRAPSELAEAAARAGNAAGAGVLRAQAWASVPFLVGAEPRGVFGWGFPRPQTFAEEQRSLLWALAQLAGAALERTRLYEHAEEARRRAESAEALAKRIAALQDQVLAVVGHDLRTPLQAISLSVRYLFERGGLADYQAISLARMSTSASRMQHIIRDLVDYSRIHSSGSIALHLEPCRIEEICSRAIAEARILYPEREVDLSLAGSGTGTWDGARVEQLVSNLVVNALQHSPATARVTVRARSDSERLQLIVHNGGPAIPPDLLPHVFDPFRHGGASKGTGLGLFIVREIVSAHGGDIGVSSTERGGTTVVVTLPRAAAPARA